MSIYALGLDPGFASLGWAIVEIMPNTERVIDMGVIETQPSAKKRKVLAADDNVRRAREIDAALTKLLTEHRPHVVCAESMSFPRNSSAAAKMAMSWGIIVARAGDRPLIQASPQEIKLAVCGSRAASKEEVEEALVDRYGKGTMWGCFACDHAFDALGAVVAGLNSETVRAMRQMGS